MSLINKWCPTYAWDTRHYLKHNTLNALKIHEGKSCKYNGFGDTVGGEELGILLFPTKSASQELNHL